MSPERGSIGRRARPITLSQRLDDLDRVAVRVGAPRNQQAPEPLVRWNEGRCSLRGEFCEGRRNVSCPEDHRYALPPRNRIEAVVITCRGDGRDADLVVVEREIDVNRISFGRDAECLAETEARVERDRAFKILAKEDDLGCAEHGCAGI
jgi:hypothetical protein